MKVKFNSLGITLIWNSYNQIENQIFFRPKTNIIFIIKMPGYRTLFISLDVWYVIKHLHYGDVVMGTVASQITSLTIVYSTVYSGTDQRKHQSSASLAFARGIHRGPVNSPHKWPVTRKMFPFDDVIMLSFIQGPVSPTCLSPQAFVVPCFVVVM